MSNTKNLLRWKRFLLMSILFLAINFLLFAQGIKTTSKKDKIETKVNMVSVNVVVTDQYGFPVSGLKQDDFEIFDDGKRERVVFFEETSKPLHIILIIDSSGSTYKKISVIKDGAINFIKRIHNARPNDKIEVINFNDDISILSDFNTSWLEKIAFIQDKIFAMGGTALYDTIFLTSKDILRRVHGRKIVVLYTDGIDNKSMENFSSAYKIALTTDATFYVITVDNMKQALQDASKDYYALSRKQYYEFMQGEAKSRNGEVDPQWTTSMRSQFKAKDVLALAYRLSYQRLERLASTTGGKFFKVSTYDEIPIIYRRISAELPFYYTLGYRPDFSKSREGEYHSIEVRMKDPRMQARYRRGYYYFSEGLATGK